MGIYIRKYFNWRLLQVLFLFYFYWNATNQPVINNLHLSNELQIIVLACNWNCNWSFKAVFKNTWVRISYNLADRKSVSDVKWVFQWCILDANCYLLILGMNKIAIRSENKLSTLISLLRVFNFWILTLFLNHLGHLLLERRPNSK